MIVNQRTLDLIKQWEGCKLTAYRDVVGVWTIGYGITANAGVGIEPCEGMVITQAQAEEHLRRAVDKFADKVAALIKVPVTANEFGACVMLSYNIGLGAFGKSTVLRELNKGNKEGASSAFHMWNKAGGKIVKGLVNRRLAEVELFMSEDAPVAEKSESLISTIIRIILTLIKRK